MSAVEIEVQGRQAPSHRRRRHGAAAAYHPVHPLAEGRAVQALAGARGARADRRDDRPRTGDRPRAGDLPEKGLQRGVGASAAALDTDTQRADRRVAKARRAEGPRVRDTDRRDKQGLVGYDHAAVQGLQGAEKGEPARQHERLRAGAQHARRGQHDRHLPGRKARGHG